MIATLATSQNPSKETLVGGFCCTQLRFLLCNTQITGYPFFSVFLEKVPIHCGRFPLQSQKEPLLFVRRPHKMERKDKRFHSVKWLFKKIDGAS
jgi:hypothetical protein